MARPVEVHPEAILEAQAAYSWYVDRNNAAAQAFLAELDRAVELISESPMRWPIHLHGTRHFYYVDFLLALFIGSWVNSSDRGGRARASKARLLEGPLRRFNLTRRLSWRLQVSGIALGVIRACSRKKYRSDQSRL